MDMAEPTLPPTVDPTLPPTVDPTLRPETSATTQTDNFYSPENLSFYARQPYESLDKFSRTIRLLVVKQDRYGGMQCRLKDGIPLSDAKGTYTAISYCAGDPKITRPVHVNSIPFNAFANLAHAIKRTYRYLYHRSKDEGTEVLLWADQICINQSDKSERSHQVGFMYAIYRSARDVAVCLSTEEKRGESAFQWIHDMYLRLSNTNPPNYSAGVNYSYDGSGFTSTVLSNMGHEFFRNGMVDTLLMFEQPWWSRAWILQEYKAATRVQFLYGRRWLPSHALRQILESFIEHAWPISGSLGYVMSRLSRDSSQYDAHVSEQSKSIALLLAKTGTLPERGRSARFVLNCVDYSDSADDFIKVLAHSRTCGAGDKRDHVYAFLGLASDDYAIKVDYSDQHSAVAVFTETARRLIEINDNLSILSHVDMRDNDQLDYPSWVPDWSSSRWWAWRLALEDIARVIEVDDDESRRGANARFLDDGRTLEVSGIYVDTIEDWAATPSYKRSKRFPLRLSQGKRGAYIWSTTNASIGDQLWILHGTETPVLLRASGTDFRFISEAPFFKPPEYENYGRKAKVYEKWESDYRTQLREPPVKVRLI